MGRRREYSHSFAPLSDQIDGACSMYRAGLGESIRSSFTAFSAPIKYHTLHWILRSLTLPVLKRAVHSVFGKADPSFFCLLPFLSLPWQSFIRSQIKGD